MIPAIEALIIVHANLATAFLAFVELLLFLGPLLHADFSHPFQVFNKTNAVILSIARVQRLQDFTREPVTLETEVKFFFP